MKGFHVIYSFYIHFRICVVDIDSIYIHSMLVLVYVNPCILGSNTDLFYFKLPMNYVEIIGIPPCFYIMNSNSRNIIFTIYKNNNSIINNYWNNNFY